VSGLVPPVLTPLVKRISVLLAEDHAIVRHGIRLLIETSDDIEIVGEANTGREAVQLAGKLRPEIVVMDIAMPLLNGLQATEKIMAASPATRVIILSANPDPEYIQQAILFGASGYLIKQSSTQFLAQAIREILKGNTYFSASIPKQLRNECQVLFDKGEALKAKPA